MNDEIKEILDDLLFTTTLPNVSVKLSEEKLNQLKDYITNLQQENERWRRVATKNFNDAKDYKLIIDNAIEHIEKHQFIFQSQYKDESNFDNHLLDILKGDSNE